MNPQHKALREFRREVADELTERLRADELAERVRMSPADQRQFGRQLINRRLERYASNSWSRDGAAHVRGRDGAGAGDPRRPVRARRPAAAARRRVDREHRRQRLCRRVGHPPTGPSTGPTHRRQRRRADRHPAHDRRRVGLTERRFDTGSPSLNLQLPDGSRLFAVMAVTSRPRGHPAPPLPQGVPRRPGGPGRSTWPCASSSAAVRARKNFIICGGRRREDDVAAGAAQRGRSRRTDRHHRGQPRAGRTATPTCTDVVALEAREENVEGEGEIDLATLVRWGLRMNPDRVIVGEVRGHEVIPMLNAMSQQRRVHVHGARQLVAVGVQQAGDVRRAGAERLNLEATNLAVRHQLRRLHRHVARQRGRGRAALRLVGAEVVGAEARWWSPTRSSCPATTSGPSPVPAADSTQGELAEVGFDALVLLRPDGWWN